LIFVKGSDPFTNIKGTDPSTITLQLADFL